MPEISSAALFVLAGAAGAAEGLAFLVLVSFWAAATTAKTRRKTAIFLRYFVRINVNELKRILIPKPGLGQPNRSKAWVIGKLGARDRLPRTQVIAASGYRKALIFSSFQVFGPAVSSWKPAAILLLSSFYLPPKIERKCSPNRKRSRA